MVIGRGRRREHLIYENKREGDNFLWSQDAEVVENTPNQHLCTTSKKKVQENNVREKKYGKKKYGEKSKGKSHVTS